MKTTKKVTSTTSSIPAGLGMGLLVSMGVTFLGAVLIAWLLGAERVGEESMGYAAMAVLAVAALLGAFTAVGRTKRLRLQISMLVGASYFLSLLAITALFFGGRYQAIGTTLVVIGISSTMVAFLPGKGEGHRKWKGKHYR